MKKTLKKLVTGLGLLLASGPLLAGYSQSQIEAMVVDEAAKTRVPTSLALAVAKVGSNFHARVTRGDGAIGVLRVHPGQAWALYRVDSDELYRPRTNIRVGLDILEALLDLYNDRWDLALAHYHLGSGVKVRANGYVPRISRGFVRSTLRWERRYATDDLPVYDDPWYIEWTDGYDRGYTPVPRRYRYNLPPWRIPRWRHGDLDDFGGRSPVKPGPYPYVAPGANWRVIPH